MEVQPISMVTAKVKAMALITKEIHMEREQSLRVIKGVPTMIMSE